MIKLSSEARSLLLHQILRRDSRNQHHAPRFWSRLLLAWHEKDWDHSVESKLVTRSEFAVPVSLNVSEIPSKTLQDLRNIMSLLGYSTD